MTERHKFWLFMAALVVRDKARDYCSEFPDAQTGVKPNSDALRAACVEMLRLLDKTDKAA